MRRVSKVSLVGRGWRDWMEMEFIYDWIVVSPNIEIEAVDRYNL